MSKTALEHRKSSVVKEKAQYAAAFGIIGVMLWVAGFPVFLLFFVGVLTFFIWKVFSSEGRNETRRIFEFYLSANEILREDDRRWYGFEIQEAIARGENIVCSMLAAPPLVSFSLGALYQKIDDHASAVKHLSNVVDDEAAKESDIVYPTKELREYVRMLRKIERSPAEAPLTSAAVRSLERARKHRGRKLLDHSRLVLSKQVIPLPQSEQTLESVVEPAEFTNINDGTELHYFNQPVNGLAEPIIPVKVGFSSSYRKASVVDKDNDKPGAERKSISEVLHDIYDKNVQ